MAGMLLACVSFVNFCNPRNLLAFASAPSLSCLVSNAWWATRLVMIHMQFIGDAHMLNRYSFGVQLSHVEVCF